VRTPPVLARRRARHIAVFVYTSCAHDAPRQDVRRVAGRGRRACLTPLRRRFYDDPVATTASPPLVGVRVVEMGTLIAGPFCAQLLADFGAEVIKVEAPGSPDPMRQWGQCKVNGTGLYWPIISRNKKAITLDLRQGPGQDLALRLIARSDVVVENFRVGTLERWGLGYDKLSSINPRLVMVRVTGYGQTGPYRERAGFGAVAEAMGGMRYITGEPDRPPVRVGVSIGDALAGTLAAFGAVMALRHRDASGRGQVVDSSIFEAVLTYMESMIPEFGLASHIRERSGTVLPGVAPSNVYPTSDGTWIVMGANHDNVFRRLCGAIGRPEMVTDRRFATHDARGRHMEILDGMVAEWTATKTTDAALAILDAAGVPAGKIFTAREMLSDPHFQAREDIIWVDAPRVGRMPMQNVFPKLSESPGSVRWAGPELGQHNDEIYRNVLGLDDGAMAAMRAQAVI
jgi:succinyl-CoA---D-citramalate CoA-transferase